MEARVGADESRGRRYRKFFVRDLDADGAPEIVIATMNGRILVYSMGTYQNIWENLEDNFSSIQAIEVADIDEDPQLELMFHRRRPALHR